MKQTEPKWLMSDWSFGLQDGAVVDMDKGIIRNAAIVSVGPAIGHGVDVDRNLVEETVRFGNAFKHGVKVHFGHQTMSSTTLGTFVGRAKNFRVDDSGEVPIARADIFLSKEAQETPHGNLYSYLLGMAENEPDMFGLSMVFKGEQFQRDENGDKVRIRHDSDADPDKPVNITMVKLIAVDFVDDPAANEDGLFSSRFDSATIAGQVSHFLDTHPQVWELLDERPELMEIFHERFKAYKARTTNFKTDPGLDVPLIDDKPPVDGKQDKTGSVEPTKPNETEDTKMEERKMFREMQDKYGSEIAAQVFAAGGSMDDALALHARTEVTQLTAQRDAFETEVGELKTTVTALEAKLEALTGGEKPLSLEDAGDTGKDPEKPKKVDCKAEIKKLESQGLTATAAQDKVLADYPEEFQTQFNVGGQNDG